MKIKTSELSGRALDWEVARLAIGYSYEQLREYDRNFFFHNFSTDWSQGGPIIERENMGVKPNIGHEKWSAQVWRNSSPLSAFGPTPLIAAMRCYVASKLGEEVEVPDAVA